jgi:hypothetical protein
MVQQDRQIRHQSDVLQSVAYRAQAQDQVGEWQYWEWSEIEQAANWQRQSSRIQTEKTLRALMSGTYAFWLVQQPKSTRDSNQSVAGPKDEVWAFDQLEA